MPTPRKPRPSGLNVFWALLASIEKTTQLEAAAISERNLEVMDVLHESKRANFERMVALGHRLGIDRQNPELDMRLKALALAEARNADAAGQIAADLRQEWERQGVGGQRLHSLKRAYVSGTLDSEFKAEG